MALRYWNPAAAANWNDINSWAQVDGGATGFSVPSSADDVYFTATNVYNCTVDVDASTLSLDMTGYTGTFSGSNKLDIYGNLKLASGASYTYTGDITFKATSAKTVDLNGISLLSNVDFNSATGDWTLLNNFSTSLILKVSKGTFDTDSYSIICSNFDLSTTDTRDITIDGGVVLTGYGDVWKVDTTNLTITSDFSSANITLTDNSANLKTFTGGSLTYRSLSINTLGTGKTLVKGDNTFISMIQINSGRTVQFENGSDNSVEYISGDGVTLESDSAGNTYTLTKTGGGVIGGSFNSVTDCIGMPADSTPGHRTWYAPAGADGGNNTDWDFTYTTDRYWVLGSDGDWDNTVGVKWGFESGGTGGFSVPTSSNSVYLDTADNITIASSTYCNNFDATTHSGNILGSGNLSIKGSADFTGFSGTISSTLELLFENSSVTKTITSDSTVLGLITINSGGTIELSDNLEAYTLELTKGTLDFNDKDVLLHTKFITNDPNTRVLNMGSGTIELDGDYDIWRITDVTNLTINCETSTIKLTSATADDKYFTGSVLGTNITYYNFWNNCALPFVLSFYGDCTFNEFKMDSGQTVKFEDLSTIKATDFITPDATITSETQTAQFTLEKLGGGIVFYDWNSVSWCIGAPALTWFGLSADDGGDNTHWTFGNARYWVPGGTGNWNATDTDNWSYTSGGPSGFSVPDDLSDVYFDVNSAAGAVVVQDATCRNLDMTGFTGSFDGVADVDIYGNVILDSTFTWTHTGTLRFISTLLSQTITSNSATPTYIELDGLGLQLLDDLELTQYFTLTSGFFDANDFNLKTGYFISNNVNTRQIDLKSGTIELTGTGISPVWNIDATNLTFNAGTSTILLSCPPVQQQVFHGAGLTYYTYQATGPTCIIDDSNTFDTFIVNSGTLHQFTAGIEIKFNNITYTGAIFESTTAGMQYTLTKLTSGKESQIITSVTDCIGIGLVLNTFNAESSAHGGNNTGWNFTTDRYWVGGDDDWDGIPATKWSIISSGTAGYPEPAITNNVFFDTNNTVGLVNGECLSLDFTGFTGTIENNGVISVNENLTLSPTMTCNFTGLITLDSIVNPQLITTYGKSLYDVTIFGNQLVQFQDDFTLANILQHDSGTLDFNNKNVTISNFQCLSGLVRTLNMGSGIITLTGYGDIWDITDPTDLTLNCDTSTIVVNNNSANHKNFIGGGQVYNNILNNISGLGKFKIFGNNTFNIFSINDNRVQTFEAGSVTNLTNLDAGDNVVLESDTLGVQFTLSCTSGRTIFALYNSIIDCIGAPLNTWYALLAADGGNNTNWIFTTLDTATVTQVQIGYTGNTNTGGTFAYLV
jgi:hypothetical protein